MTFAHAYDDLANYSLNLKLETLAWNMCLQFSAPLILPSILHTDDTSVHAVAIRLRYIDRYSYIVIRNKN